MTVTNFQLVAIKSIMNGTALAVPNISANLASFNTVGVVASYSNVYIFGNIAFTNGNITAGNWANLQVLGSNSFPVFFGTTPWQYSQNLGSGPLLAKVSPRVSNLFPAGKDLSSPIQSISSAYSYAQQKSDLISSAATATFGSQSNPVYFSTGGLSAFGGSIPTPTTMQAVGVPISQLGLLINFQGIASSFSVIGILNQIINNGAMHIGNLHINFFNKVITDPILGRPVIITPDFINQISTGVVQSSTNQNTYPILANNRYEASLRVALDDALLDTSDLEAVLTYIGVLQPIPTAAQIASGVESAPSTTIYSPVINKFSDCLDIENMLGPAASAIIKTGNGFGNGLPLTADVFVTGLLINVKSSQNILSSEALGNALISLDTLTSSPNIAALTSPLTANDFANICSVVGSGSGPNNTILVADVLGSTNLNESLSSAVTGLQQLNTIGNAIVLQHIQQDTSNLALALSSNIPVTGIGLSNGVLYYTQNNLVSNAVPLIEQNATILAQANLATYFSDYYTVAQTHNNSITNLPISGINVAGYANNVSSIISFVTQLPNYTSNPSNIMDVVDPLLTPIIGGQSIQAVLSDAINQQVINNLGITTETQSAPSSLASESQIPPAVPLVF